MNGSSDRDFIPQLGKIEKGSKVVVMTGAGVSQESGIRTFRDDGGLWEEYNIYEIATPQAWEQNQDLVLDFYNQRRKQLLDVEPNDAHRYLAKLEQQYIVEVITQNIDDLHERGGSSRVLHLHGELLKARSSVDDSLIYSIDGWEIKKGQLCEKGSQLRPHVVWFGESVPNIEPAARITQQADLVIVVGTSLAVYPAAGLLHETRPGTPVVAIDPGTPELSPFPNVCHIREKAAAGVKKLVLKMLDTA